MARGPATTVHVGKAAALIVVALLLGVIVIRDNSSGAGPVSADDIREAINDSFTTTTVAPDDDGPVTPTTGPLRQPGQIKVVAINATGTAGKAGSATDRLRTAGYNVLQPGNANAATTNSRPASLIYVVSAGYEREAEVVAALFGLPASAVRALPNPSPSADIRSDANLAVLVGTGITL